MDEDEPTTSRPTLKAKRRTGPPKFGIKHPEQTMLSALIYDVDSILKKFNEFGGNSFYEFGQCFIDLEFPTIFLGRYSTSELVEFSELLISYAASFMFSLKESNQNPPFLFNVKPDDVRKITTSRKDRALKERIFGVFLTYCLYFTQPQTNIANIKLSVQQMKELRLFCERELLSGQCNEALFCVNRLVDQHAFMVVPFEKEFNPVLARRFNITEMTSDYLDISDSTTNETLPSLKNIQRDFTLAQTDIIHKRYVEEKDKHKLPDGLYSVTDNLISRIGDIILKTQQDLEHMNK